MEYIDKKVVLELIYENVDSPSKAYKAILQYPSLSLRKKGYWIPQDFNKKHGNITTLVYYYPKCSECGEVGNDNYLFCPYCGADMKGGQDEFD